MAIVKARSLTLLAGVVLFSAACGGNAPVAATKPPAAVATPAAVTEMNIPYESASFALTQFYVPLDLKLFEKYGVKVTTEYIATGTTVVQSMLSGQTPVGNASQDAVIGADLNGGNLVMIASGPEKLYFEVYAAPSLQRMADLKGKKLGVTRLGSSTDFSARFVLGKNNLQPDKDVAILQMGGVGEILAGIQSGAIDAGMLSAPTTLKAKQAGLRQLANLTDYDFDFYSGPLVANRAWLGGHHTEALSLVKGYSEGIAVIFRDKATTMSILGKYTKTEDQAVLEESYQTLLKILPRKPLPKVNAVKNGLAQSTSAAAKTADPNNFIDPSLVEELDKMGFYDALYK